jgi:ribonuclease R
MIDNPDSADRDDAIHVQRLDDGFVAHVHIADVARLVPPGSSADRRARRRGRTRYLPDSTIPMLPDELERAGSLTAGEPKPTCLISVHVDLDGSTRSIEVSNGWLEHPVALSYSAAADAIEDPASPQHEMLSDAQALASLLLNRRRAGGALAVYELSRGWATDEEGNVVQLGMNERNAGYVIVQELMIAANEAAAHWCVERELPILFRNHRVSAVAPPREELLEDLAAVEAEPVGARLESVRQRLALVLKPAAYAPYVGGHYGLGLLAYTHVTSPLRRYPDLVNQRILLAAAAGKPSPYKQDDLAAYAEEANLQLRRWRGRQADRLRAAAKDDARQKLAEGVLRSLDADEFHRVVKVAIGENRYSPEIVDEIVRRTDGGVLTPRDACYALFFTRGSRWRSVRDRVAQWAADEPSHSITLVTMYTQLAEAGQLEWETEDIGSPERPCFAVQVSLLDGKAPPDAPEGSGGVVASPRRLARNKREARQQAALGLIAALAGVPDQSRDLDLPAPAEPGRRARQLPEGHPVAAVNELSQVGELRELDWSFTSSGSPHETTHDCVVRAIDGRTDVSLTGKGSGPSKAIAKAAAASSLLDLLRQQDAEDDGSS